MLFLFSVIMGYLVAAGMTNLVSLSLAATAWGNVLTYLWIFGGIFMFYGFAFLTLMGIMLLFAWLKDRKSNRRLNQLRHKVRRDMDRFKR